MGLPFYQIIDILVDDSVILLGKLNSITWGHYPVVLNLLPLNAEDSKRARSQIESFFVEKNISSKFPYPTYILSKLIQNDGKIRVYASESNLPDFFKKRGGRPGPKETNLLKKIELKQAKINNYDLTSLGYELFLQKDYNRELYEEHRFEAFCLTLKKMLDES